MMTKKLFAAALACLFACAAQAQSVTVFDHIYEDASGHIYVSGGPTLGTWNGSTFTPSGALIPLNNLGDLANAATARTNLGLGTAATQNTGTSGANVPLLNGVNTWSGAQTFSAGISPTTSDVTSAGSLAAPSLALGAAGTGSGFYAPASGEVGFSVGGVGIWDWNKTYGNYFTFNKNVALIGIMDGAAGPSFRVDGSASASATAATIKPDRIDNIAGLGAYAAGGVSIVVDKSGVGYEALRADTNGDVTVQNLATPGPVIATGGKLSSVSALSVPLGGTGGTSMTANALPKGNGTSPYTASALIDNGSFVYTNEPINLQGNALGFQLVSSATITTGQLVSIDNIGKGTPATISTTDGIVGVAENSVASGGAFNIAITGRTSCVFDGATTAGDWVTISSTVAGDCHDTGSATRATGQQQVGQVLSTNAGAGTYAVNIDIQFTPAGGSGSGNVTGPGSSVAGDLSSYSDATGKVLGDSGVYGPSVVQTLKCPHDGVTDAQPCIQAIVNAAAPGTLLTLAPGNTYIHSTIIIPSLTNQIRLTGSGNGASEISTDQDIKIIQVGSYAYSGSNDWSYSTDPAYHDYVDNLYLVNTGATKTSTIGVSLQGAEYGAAKDITCNGIAECVQVDPITAWEHIERIRSHGTGVVDTLLINGAGYNSSYNSTGNNYNDIMGIGVSRAVITFNGCAFGDFVVSNVNGTGVASGGQGSAGGAIAAIYLDQTGKCGDGSTSYGSRWAISNVKMDGVSDYVIKGIGVDHGSVSNLADGGNVTNELSFDGTSSSMAFGPLTTQYTIGTLPSCTNGTKGLRVTITNGVASPTFTGTVSTTGSNVRSVTCSGASYIYE